ncbi:MAG: nucleotidyltransferase domain-containing protein [Candidatus Bathyarchaeota archaeon]|nr:MAG: nucleotidyltransferase domain-containing protein [Candidatus Bathyarchaeota archaeon]
MKSYLRAEQRKLVAKEAAEMLYTGQEKEYRQAKLHAAKTLGLNLIPSNIEVATELNAIAEQREGETRCEKLVMKRLEALEVMKTLERFGPILVGSVWRGTAHHNSDIDIVAYSENPQRVLKTLQDKSYVIMKSEIQKVTKRGKAKSSLHIYVDLPSESQVEVVVRDPEEASSRPTCEIYGDAIVGLDMLQLKKLLKEDSGRSFVPDELAGAE